MANAARFTNPELGELDRRITEAGGRAAAREAAIFQTLVGEVLAQAGALRRAGRRPGHRPTRCNPAPGWAEPGTWCRPHVSDDSAFCVTAARHPVVEAALPTAPRSSPTIATCPPHGGCCC